MEQDLKDILLKDLCARLPYGVKVSCLDNFNHDWYNLELIDIKDNEVYISTSEPYFSSRYSCIESIKPYLFPLSSMTEEQKEEFNSYFASVPYYGDNIHIPYYFVESLIDFYNKHHLDYRGLIKKGLAIDATGLNIY